MRKVVRHYITAGHNAGQQQPAFDTSLYLAASFICCLTWDSQHLRESAAFPAHCPSQKPSGNGSLARKR